MFRSRVFTRPVEEPRWKVLIDNSYLSLDQPVFELKHSSTSVHPQWDKVDETRARKGNRYINSHCAVIYLKGGRERDGPFLVVAHLRRISLALPESAR
jgi:hypothetical protein